MSAEAEISRRAALVDSVAHEVCRSRAVVAGLRDLRWRSPAALAYRAEVDAAVADLVRVGGRLDDLAADLRRLAAAVGAAVRRG